MPRELTVRVPDIGDFQDVVVIEVLVAPGARVEREGSLVTLESDKATMEVPSPAAGVVRQILVRVDDRVSEGSPLVVLEVEQAAEASPPAQKAEQKPAKQPAAPAPAAAPAAKPAPAPAPAPAHDYDFDVVVLGSGPGGYTAAFRAA